MKPIPAAVAAGLALFAISAHASQQPAPQQEAPSAQPPAPATAQGPGETQPKEARSFTQEQLEQMVAPIALYPDALLTQILMGSTYPLEIVQAERWVGRNQGLSGSALEEALKTQDWDPSVKALCGFPTVLKQMSDDLDWTRDLGDAFLGQKDELMDTVQGMRKKALDAGNLKTTQQQKVVQDHDTVVIEPASPDVVYVPAYSPLVVYGGWSYPYWYYPYWYYPPPYGAGFITFGIGFFWGYSFWGWGHCDWHHHSVFVDAEHFRDFHRATSARPLPQRFEGASSGRVEWSHDPVHRQGVNYRSPRIAEHFGGAPGMSRVLRDRARGFDPGFERPDARAAAPGAARRPEGAPETRPSLRAPAQPARPPERTAPPASRPGGEPLGRNLSPWTSSSAGRGALSGFRDPGFDRSASGRGAMSRGRGFLGSRRGRRP